MYLPNANKKSTSFSHLECVIRRLSRKSSLTPCHFPHRIVLELYLQLCNNCNRGKTTKVSCLWMPEFLCQHFPELESTIDGLMSCPSHGHLPLFLIIQTIWSKAVLISFSITTISNVHFMIKKCTMQSRPCNP